MYSMKRLYYRAVSVALIVAIGVVSLTSCSKPEKLNVASNTISETTKTNNVSTTDKPVEEIYSDSELIIPIDTKRPDNVPVKEIGSIDKARQLKLFSDVVDAELKWLAALQAPNGAMPENIPDKNGKAKVVTFFSAQACFAMLLQPEKYGQNVKKYLDWYFSHMNTAETDISGVDGTMYDYELTYNSDHTQVTETPVINETTKDKHYDSTDAYAGITLKLIWDYTQATKDTQYAVDKKTEIDRLINAIYGTMNDGLCFATPKHFIKYVMDNFEVYRGLTSLINIYKDIYLPLYKKDSTEYKECEENIKKYTKSANMVITKIEDLLWDEKNGYYNVGLDASNRVYMTFDWTNSYPCAMAQIEAIAMGVISPDSPRAKRLYESFTKYWSSGKPKQKWERLDIGSPFLLSNNALCAANMGDINKIETFITYYNYRIEDGRDWPIYNADVGMAVLAAAKCIELIKSYKEVEQKPEDAFVPPDPKGIMGAQSFGGADDITKKGTIICSVMPDKITGSGSRDLEIIRAGKWINAITAINTSQYDTFTSSDQSEAFVGIEYKEKYKFNKFIFQEGMHFNNGGWFAELPKIQVKVNGKWVDVKNQKSNKEYPKGQSMNDYGDFFEIYSFEFDQTEGTAIRIYGKPGGSPAFLSIGQIQVCGVK